jgi:hypothetical protein
MPFAPVTIAVRPLISFENVGKLWYMPLSWRGSDLEPIMADAGSVEIAEVDRTEISVRRKEEQSNQRKEERAEER